MLEVLAPDLVLAVVAMAQAMFALDRREATGFRRVVAEFRVVLGLMGLGVLLSLIGVVAPAWAPVPVQVLAATGIAFWFSVPVKGAGLGIVSTAVFTVAVVLGYGSYAHGYVRVIEPTHLAELTPDQAAQADGRTTARFSGVRCIHELRGGSVKYGNETSVTTTVVPLVGTDWAPPQPVPAWIGVGAQPPYASSWEKICPQEPNDRVFQALRISDDGQAGFAASDAMDKHGLEQVPDAPHFNFAPTAKQVRSKLGLGRTVVIVLTFCWLINLAVAGAKARKAKT